MTHGQKFLKHLALILMVSFSTLAFAQVGEVIWEENFDNLDNWLIETGNGSWGWGNGELEYYQSDNIEIAEIADEPGNNALKITARNETGAHIVDQWGNPLQYTSGRLNTKSFVSIKYGVIESRVRIPNIDLGGWPAVWMLGTSNYNWPPLRRDRHDGNGIHPVVPQSARYPQRRQRTRQLLRESNGWR